MANDQDLAGLPEDVQGALLECERALNFMFAGESLDTVRTELLWLTRENANLRSACTKTLAANVELRERAERAEAELAAMKRRISEASKTTPMAMQTITPSGIQASVPLGNTDGCFAYVPPWLAGKCIALLPVGDINES